MQIRSKQGEKTTNNKFQLANQVQSMHLLVKIYNSNTLKLLWYFEFAILYFLSVCLFVSWLKLFRVPTQSFSSFLLQKISLRAKLFNFKKLCHLLHTLSLSLSLSLSLWLKHSTCTLSLRFHFLLNHWTFGSLSSQPSSGHSDKIIFFVYSKSLLLLHLFKGNKT